MAGKSPTATLAELERMRKEAESGLAPGGPRPGQQAASAPPVGPTKTAVQMGEELTGAPVVMPAGDYEPGDELAGSDPEPAGSMTGELLRKIMELLVAESMKDARKDAIREDIRKNNQI